MFRRSNVVRQHPRTLLLKRHGLALNSSVTQALRSFNISVVDTTISNVDHFTLVENLTNENEDLTKRIIRLVMEIDDPIES